MSDAEPTALYRFFDEQDRLLYVGITCNPEERWRRHASDKTWWSTVARKTLDWHPDRETALLAECLAITTERPRWNVAKPNPDDPLRSAGGAKSPGRPKTGQKPMVSFRPDADLLAEFNALVAEAGEKRTDALINAMEAWVKKHRRDKPANPDSSPRAAG